MVALKLTVKDDHVLVEVHVVPRASKSAVQGVHDGKLKVSLDAPPVDGAANEALVALFAKALKLPRRDVRIVRGEASRQKLLALHGASEAAVRALVPAG
jgi:uncharacterized protein